MSLKICALVFYAFAATDNPSLSQTPEDDIRSLRTQSNSAIAEHNVDAVTSFLDAEYQITVGSGKLFHGKAGEPEGWRAEFATADDLVYVRTPVSVEVSSSGVRAAEIGEWVGSWTTPAGATHARGQYAAHWVKVGDTWKIRSELFVTLGCEGKDCS